MDSTFIFGLANILVSFGCIYMTALCSVKREYIKAYDSLKYYASINGVIALFYGIYYIYPSLNIDSYILSVIHALKPYIALTFLLFVISIAFPKKRNYKFLLLFIIPLGISIFSLTFKLHSLFITYSKNYFYEPVRHLKETYHIVFYIYFIYNLIIVLTSLILLIKHIYLLSSHKKRQKANLKIVLIVYALFNIVVLINQFQITLWLSLLLILSCVYMIYFTLYDNEERKIKEEGEKELIDNHPFPVVLQDSSEKVVYANAEAIKVCQRLKDYKIKDHYYDEIYDCFSFYSLKEDVENKGLQVKVDKLLQRRDSGELFFIHTKPVYDKDKEEIGKLHMLVAVSQMQIFLKNLEDNSFRDTLCNVYNSYYLNIKEDELCHEKNLPLSILRIRVNDIQKIKDHFTVKEGEEYVMLCMFIIRQALRRSDIVFRLSEEEFLIVLPNTSRKQLNNITSVIKEKQKQYSEFYNLKIVLSLGGATTTVALSDLDSLMDKAEKDFDNSSVLEEDNQT